MTDDQWREVCRIDQLEKNWGEAALFGTEQLAVFLAWDGQVHITSNIDPRTHQGVMSRGIVGDHEVGGERRPTIASPLYKESYDLETGECYTSPNFRLSVYDSRVRDGVVEVDLSSATEAVRRELPQR
ncbi:nitrite reductase small subunit NirD [Helcobacillus massiliensis]|uniref:Nitrite reductase (NADH) small subunit n=1 Tax=Helcobacillus massiliensis TaxID=521392 RepID=A0A839QUV2_9MICO|nr:MULTISPECIES: nitrite reductase small subunit NirD [Helcobacillus]MBB3022560.1 nitrite reductase (NADH) small subunit [Helcobacillus massiliensis]MCG7426612.1 nitrite reductase small subunit NirD [Helcobacillus sp. ACRRO]MCT1557194.1 nitrite reductase small subunit NirD [Helcobacillus massiliensis]MCT2036956.1 nitrite reductase small subunit NirD [Helcobacillus massiliensis]MCT2332654.1 nitrite reductase small subunit NirD [Helcobacillus massiliensis]